MCVHMHTFVPVGPADSQKVISYSYLKVKLKTQNRFSHLDFLPTARQYNAFYEIYFAIQP